MKKYLLVLLLVLLMAGGVVLLRKRKAAIEEAPTPRSLACTVRTVQPQTRSVTSTMSFLARMEAVDSAAISSKLSGRILEMPVRESDRVGRGDLLVRLDDRELRATRQSLQAQLAAAQEELDYSRTLVERDQALYSAGGLALEKLQASQVALARSRATVRDLQEKIRSLDSQLSYLNLIAPYDGIVGTVSLRPGDLASPGRPILTLNSLDRKLTFRFIPGDDTIRIGMEVRWQGDRIGTIARIYDDASNGLSVAEVRPDPEHRPDLPAKSYLTVTVVTGRATGCSVPLASLLHRPEGTTIMVYRQDHFEEQSVRVTVQGRTHALIAPCTDAPVAVGPEARLSLLPTYGHHINVSPAVYHE